MSTPPKIIGTTDQSETNSISVEVTFDQYIGLSEFIDYYEYKENNYYNKYRYRAKFRIDGLGYTSYAKTPEDLVNLSGNDLKFNFDV